MPEPTLFEFVDQLADAGLLRRVSGEVAARFELAELTRQLRIRSSLNAPAVLFERVGGATFPVLATSYGSDTALATAFGVEVVEDLPTRIGTWLRPQGGRSVRDVLSLLPALTKSFAWGDSGSQARCQQVVRLGRDVDLSQLPVPHAWPAESGPTLTGGLLITRDADGEQTVETTIAEVIDEQTLRVRFTDDSPGLDSWSQARSTGRQLDVAITFGGPPSLWPTVWLGEVTGLDANVLGEVFGRPQPETVRGRTVSATVPAASELVIEGRIDPEAPPAEPGRVTTDGGVITSSGRWATVSVHAITHAAAAVLPTVVRHEPPHDLSALDRLAERCLEELVRSLLPGVESLRTPPWGQARQTLLLGVHATRPGQAREIAAAVRGMHGLARAKVIVLLDATVPLDDPAAVLSRVVHSTAPARDIAIVDAAWNPDDPSGHDVGSAVVIDATGNRRSSPVRSVRPSPSVAEAVKKRLAGE